MFFGADTSNVFLHENCVYAIKNKTNEIGYIVRKQLDFSIVLASDVLWLRLEASILFIWLVKHLLTVFSEKCNSGKFKSHILKEIRLKNSL